MAKFKEYLFTNEEMLIIRDALIEEYQRKKADGLCGNDVPGMRLFKLLEVLKEQFKEDCANG